MIFLQRVNGLRHYPVASALAQTFPHPVILNETRLPSALTKAAANDHGNKERRFSSRRIQKRRLEGAAPCFIAPPTRGK